MKRRILMILGGGHANDDLLTRFRAEAEAVAQLQNPNIVQIYEIGEESGLPYFSLEFVEGRALDAQRKGESLEQQGAAELTEQIARAIFFAHEAGIVHRDLEPANILLTRDGIPKVSDFGLVKRTEDEEVVSQTQTGAFMGTPRSMAPEQARGRTDIGPPADLETICFKCLRKDIARCYETADDLRRYLDGIPILARPVSRPELVWRWCRRDPTVASPIDGFVLPMVIGTATSTIFGVKANELATAESTAREDAEGKQTLAEENEEKALANEALAIKHEERALSREQLR